MVCGGSRVFSDSPHIVLMNNGWDDETNIAEQQFTVINASTAAVESYRSMTQAYSIDEFKSMLSTAGFTDCEVLSAWGKETIEEQDVFVLLRGNK